MDFTDEDKIKESPEKWPPAWADYDWSEYDQDDFDIDIGGLTGRKAVKKRSG